MDSGPPSCACLSVSILTQWSLLADSLFRLLTTGCRGCQVTKVRSGERGSPLSLACTGRLEQGTLPKTEVMKVGGVPADVNLNFRTMTKSSSRIRTALSRRPRTTSGLWGKVSPGWVATSGSHFTEASVGGDVSCPVKGL